MQKYCQACKNTLIASRALSARGARLTELRRDVLKILHHSKNSIGAYELFDQLKADGKASAPPAVYRVLDFLVNQGLAHKLRSVPAYTACSFGPHHHQAAFLICRNCGAVREMKNNSLESLEMDAKIQGFQIDNITLEASGLCGSCQ